MKTFVQITVFAVGETTWLAGWINDCIHVMDFKLDLTNPYTFSAQFKGASVKLCTFLFKYIFEELYVCSCIVYVELQ